MSLTEAPNTITIGALDISAEMQEGLRPTHTGGVQWVDLNCIDPNPWQPRIGEDHEHIKKLAESIATNNLLQIPSARRHPTHVGHYELAFGHSRLAAFKFLRDATDQGARFETMPLNIVELSDRQMADAAAAENVARKDLTAIEVARGIKRYIDDFNATQIEAGRVFGYNAQSSVSNLLRLLQLPDEVQVMVNNGEIAERHARELVPLARLPEAAVVKAAQEIVHDLKEKRYEHPDSIVENIVEELADKHGVTIGRDVWDMAWPKKPIDAAGEADGDKGEPGTVPACKGCQHFYERQHLTSVCLKPACYQLKMRIWRQHELERLSKKLDIAVAKPEEKKLHVVFNGDYTGIDFAKQAIESKHESLRLMPAMDKRGSGYGHWVKDVMGSSVVWLATTDLDALKKAVLKARANQRGAGSNEADDYQAKVRKENEERQKRRKACDKLVSSAAPAFEPLFTPELVSLVERAILSYDLRNIKPDDRATEITKRCINSACEIDPWNPDAERTKNKIIALAKAMKVKLPAGWEHDAVAVPVNGKSKSSKKKG